MGVPPAFVSPDSRGTTTARPMMSTTTTTTPIAPMIRTVRSRRFSLATCSARAAAALSRVLLVSLSLAIAVLR